MQHKRILWIMATLLIVVGMLFSGCSADDKLSVPSVVLTAGQTPSASETAAAVTQTADPQAAATAKNVILLIGDGMGIGQVTLGRIANGNKPLTLDSFKHAGYVSTYPDDNNEFFVTDSAAAGTAMATGVKTNNQAVGVDNSGKAVKSILEYAKEAGKATGLVTTTRLTDATPAAFAAHNPKRGDEQLTAAQMLKTAPDVMLGGGGDNFKSVSRADKKDLLAQAKSAGYTVTTDLDGFKAAKDGKLLGLFSSGMLPYAIDKNTKTPKLKDMAAKALDILKMDPDGFFVMIEGARIDHACHAHDAPTCAKEVLEFDAAVKTALEFAQKDGNTLVIVTADHETGGLSIGSQSKGMTFVADMLKKQDASIFEGVMDDVSWDTMDHAAFAKKHFGIENLTEEELKALESAYAAEKSDRQGNKNFYGRALATLASERTNTGWTTREHSGNDVLVLADGPSVGEFSGHIDNTDIFRIMKQAMGL